MPCLLPSLLLLLLGLWSARPVSACQVHLCFNEYTSLAHGYSQMHKFSLLRDFSSRDARTQQYCRLLEAYNQCMKGLNKSCRGKLDYHAVIAHVRKWLDDYNCTGSQRTRHNVKATVSLRQQQEAAQRREQERQQQQQQAIVSAEAGVDSGRQPVPPSRGRKCPSAKRSRSATLSLTSGSQSLSPRAALVMLLSPALVLLIFVVR